MTPFIARTLGTAAVATGLLVAGAATAGADTGTNPLGTLGGSLGAPLSVGGLSLGVTGNGSSGSGANTVTDRHSLSVTTEETTADPRAALESMTSGGSSASVSSPLHLGGLTVTGDSQSSSSLEGRLEATLGDTTCVLGLTHEGSSSTHGFLDTGSINLSPNGSVVNDGDGTTTGSLGLPLTTEGSSAGVTDERSGTSTVEHSTLPDCEGTDSAEGSGSSTTDGGLDLGGLTTTPGGTLTDTLLGDGDALGGLLGGAGSGGRTVLDLAAPFTSDASSGWVSHEGMSAFRGLLGQAGDQQLTDALSGAAGLDEVSGTPSGLLELDPGLLQLTRD